MGALGSSTQVVDGQRNTFPSSYAFAPPVWGVQTTGVPQVSPTVPPYLSGAAIAGPGGGSEGVGGYGTAGNNGTVAAIANANPWNIKVSPVIWAVGFLILGLLLLNGIHWRKVTLEGASEHAHLGTLREDAAEEA